LGDVARFCFVFPCISLDYLQQQGWSDPCHLRTPFQDDADERGMKQNTESKS